MLDIHTFLSTDPSIFKTPNSESKHADLKEEEEPRIFDSVLDYQLLLFCFLKQLLQAES